MADQMLQRTDVRVLAFIRGYISRRGYAPSMREIGDGVGVASLSTVAYQLDRLEQAGRIKRIRNIPRSIVVVEEADHG